MDSYPTYSSRFLRFGTIFKSYVHRLVTGNTPILLVSDRYLYYRPFTLFSFSHHQGMYFVNRFCSATNLGLVL